MNHSFEISDPARGAITVIYRQVTKQIDTSLPANIHSLLATYAAEHNPFTTEAVEHLLAPFVEEGEIKVGRLRVTRTIEMSHKHSWGTITVKATVDASGNTPERFMETVRSHIAGSDCSPSHRGAIEKALALSYPRMTHLCVSITRDASAGNVLTPVSQT